MRISGEQVLGEEAAGVVRQAVSLAGRRGHAQATPLHIASAMLSASTECSLRAACMRSQSHLLQHNALDLCLDLALDRLAVARPASAARLRGGGDPAPSNAFVAALKRAQARCRSGAVGGHTVELSQLVVSVLDDPSVDRVMRAAGFSTSQVRACVQNAVVSLDVASVPEKIRAGGEPSLEAVRELHLPIADVPNESECQASEVNSGEKRQAFFGGTEVVATTIPASLPPWVRRYKDTTCIRSYCGTNLQADVACRRRPKFTELTAQNLKILCDALELRVPRHGNIVPGISSTVLRCRSGVTRRKAAGDKPPRSSAATTWLVFHGRDGGGKTAVARELARLVFGSYADFTTLQGNPEIPARSGELASLKRQRSSENDADGNGGDVGARLFEAIVENPHRVIMIDGVDRLDRDSEMRIKNGITGGTMMGACSGDVVGLEDVIVVLSSEALDSRPLVSASSPRVKRRFSRQNRDEGVVAEMEVRSRRRLGWDLNICAADGDEGGEEDSLADDDEGILNAVDGVFLFI